MSVTFAVVHDFDQIYKFEHSLYYSLRNDYNFLILRMNSVRGDFGVKLFISHYITSS